MARAIEVCPKQTRSSGAEPRLGAPLCRAARTLSVISPFVERSSVVTDQTGTIVRKFVLLRLQCRYAFKQHMPNDSNAPSTDLVQRVLQRVPVSGRVHQVNHVCRRYATRQERQMVVIHRRYLIQKNL